MNFHDITMTSITGDQVTFDEYRGKMVLVVNVASA
jgi:glutathione peroxidase-family protein